MLINPFLSSLISLKELCTIFNSTNFSEAFYSYEKGKVYLSNAQEYGFTASDTRSVGDGVHLYVGSTKGIQFIEGKGGRGHQEAALVIDSKAYFKLTNHIETCHIFKRHAFTQRNSFNFKRLIDYPGKKPGFHDPVKLHYKVAEIVGHQHFAQNGLSKREIDLASQVCKGQKFGFQLFPCLQE